MRSIGRYRLDCSIGSGAFATVWKGSDPALDTDVAVKVLADNWALHADVRERFLTEAQLLRRIDSRRVVRVHDVGVDDDRPYFVMDYIRGGTLADRVGQLAPGEALRLAVEAAEGVQLLHEAGLIHRDVKPTNLLVDDTCEPVRVLVADLGTAKRLADASIFTVTVGTPAYMAPEQATGSNGFDGRADVFSLAVVTWELLTGHRPDPELLARDVRRAVRRSPRDRTSTEIVGVDPQVVDVILAAMSRDPAARPSDPRSFARALGAAGPVPHGRTAATLPPVLVWTVAGIVFGLAVFLSWLLI